MRIDEKVLKRLLEEKKNGSAAQVVPTPTTAQVVPTPTPTPTPTLTATPTPLPYNGPTPVPTPTPTLKNDASEENTLSELFNAFGTAFKNLPKTLSHPGLGLSVVGATNKDDQKKTEDEDVVQVSPVFEPKKEMGYSQPTIEAPVADAAMNYIREQYESLNPQRGNKIDSLIEDYLNREDFRYNPNADMLFQNYLAAMQNAGQMAMRDTMGQAAMLTGGYGSSYATAAANGAYNSYLQKANEALPDYYNIAANAYDRQGNDLLSQIQLLQNQDDEAFNRWLNQMKMANSIADSGNTSDTADVAYDTMTSTQENNIMSSALKTWIESNGNESEISKLLDGMSGYNLSDEFRQKVKDYVDSHSTKITKVKDKAMNRWDVYTDGTNEYTYKELMDQFGDYFTDEQKNKIKELSEGKWYIF